MQQQGDLEPTRDEIARCAYGLWEQSGRVHGKDREHWLAAEAMLRGNRVAGARYDVNLLPLQDRQGEVSAVRAIRDATGLDLGDIQRAVEGAPARLLAGVDDKRAELVSAALYAAGVSVEVVAASD